MPRLPVKRARGSVYAQTVQANARRKRTYANARTARMGTMPATRGAVPSYGSLRVGGLTEKKYNDVEGNVGINVANGNFILLNGIEQGPSMSQRIGGKINMKSIYIRGLIAQELAIAGWGATSGSSNACFVRMIIFYDSQPNSYPTPLGAADLLMTTASLTPKWYRMQLNIDNRDRFKIIKDKTFCLGTITVNGTATGDPDQVSTSSPVMLPIKVFKTLPNLESIYTGSTGDASALRTGALWLAFFASPDQSSGTAYPAVYDIDCRLRYLDV